MRPRPALLFVIDGLRPDAIDPRRTPTIWRLMNGGAHTLNGRTVVPSATLPAHTSLFYGVGPDRHGVTTNTWSPPVRPTPSLFTVLRAAGLRAGSFYNWEELRDMAPPGQLETSVFLSAPDARVAEEARRHLGGLDFAFVYFGETDLVGHREGWMSRGYLGAVARADGLIARVLDAAGDGAAVVVTSDHGGHGRTHGSDRPEDVTVPLVLHGPGAPERLPEPAGILDVAPTLTALLGVPAPGDWEGRSLLQGP
ncbi:alkaline phosphatase family protein [Oceanithermus profundus]